MELNNIKELIENKELLPDLGIMISYGTGEDLVSMGLLFVEGYYDSTGKKLEVLPLDKSGIDVEFVEYELTENLEVRKKKNGAKVYMPYDKAKTLYGVSASKNYDIVQETTQKEYEGRKLLANFDKGLSRLYSEMPELIQEGIIGFESSTLESLEGSFVSEEGKDMGIDFRVFPFLYDRIREKYLEMNIRNDEPIDKQKVYNYIYEFSKNKNLEKELKLDGDEVFPGPGVIQGPDILYERDQEEVHIRR